MWKPIKDYEDLYLINTNGQVLSIKSNRILKEITVANGYLCVNLSRNNNHKPFRIHRLVAQAFIDNPLKKLQINHKDGNKLNNTMSNLEWCTASENQIHAYKNGLHKRGNKMCAAGKESIHSIKVNQYDLNNNFIKCWDYIKLAGESLNIHSNSISYCCKGKYKSAGKYIWKYFNN